MFCFCFLGDGNCSDTRGLEIAVNQRVDDALTSKLPMFYLVNRPHISLVPTAYPLQINLDHKSLSLNWAQGDNSLEIVDGLSGKITERLELILSLKSYIKQKKAFIEILFLTILYIIYWILNNCIECGQVSDIIFIITSFLNNTSLQSYIVNGEASIQTQEIWF